MVGMTQPEYLDYRRLHTSTENVLLRVRFLEVRNILKLIKHRHNTLLEIGCGDGSATIYLALRGLQKEIIGVDVDKTAIQRAQQTAHYLKQQQLLYVVASATHLPIRDTTINSILCHQVLEHIPNPSTVLTECHRVLNTQGKILITTPSKTFSPLSSDWFESKICGYLHVDKYAGHLHRFNPRTLLQVVREKGFTVKQSLFYQQYITCLMVLIITLLQTRKLRTNHTKAAVHIAKTLPNVAFMISYTIETRLLPRLPCGSNIIILASK